MLSQADPKGGFCAVRGQAGVSVRHRGRPDTKSRLRPTSRRSAISLDGFQLRPVRKSGRDARALASVAGATPCPWPLACHRGGSAWTRHAILRGRSLRSSHPLQEGFQGQNGAGAFGARCPRPRRSRACAGMPCSLTASRSASGCAAASMRRSIPLPGGGRVAPVHGPQKRIGTGDPRAVAQPEAVQRLAEPAFRTTGRHSPAQAPRCRFHTSGSATGSAERRPNPDSGKAATVRAFVPGNSGVVEPTCRVADARRWSLSL